jgi:hypothetical protein
MSTREQVPRSCWECNRRKVLHLPCDAGEYIDCPPANWKGRTCAARLLDTIEAPCRSPTPHPSSSAQNPFLSEDIGHVAVSFSHSVTTKLPRDNVWSLVIDITNWPKFSDIYSDLRWEGTPWAEGSALVGQLNYPIVVSGRYVIRKCNPPRLIRYLSQTHNAGFATERTISLEELPNGTLIRVEAFVVGQPDMPGGALAFLKSLTERWFDDLARFCDNYAVDCTDSDASAH